MVQEGVVVIVLLLQALPPEVERALPRIESARDAAAAMPILTRAVEAAASAPEESARRLREAVDAYVAKRVGEIRGELLGVREAWPAAEAGKAELREARERLIAEVQSGGAMREATDALRAIWHREIVAEPVEELRLQVEARAAALNEDRVRLMAAIEPLGGTAPPEERPVLDRIVHEEFGRAYGWTVEGQALEDWQWNRGIERYHREEMRLPRGVPECVREHVLIVNEHREMAGRRALALDPRFIRAAMSHSAVMKEEGRIFHDGGPDGDPGDRLRRAGYRGAYGENVAQSSTEMDPAAPFWQWVGSQGHHRNMLVPDFTLFGAGVDGGYWTQVFGAGDLPREAQRCIERERR